ncbi:hypothetical protein SDJN03_21069, partial [Cucurbita argyrosperma subsp. sororia]
MSLITSIHKLRSCDVSFSGQLVNWRVVDLNLGLGLNMFDMSAPRIVDHLLDDEDDDLYTENLEGIQVQSRGSNDEMGFCHVDVMLEPVVEDNQEWLLVGEM